MEETPPVISHNTSTEESDTSGRITVSKTDDKPGEEQDDQEKMKTEDEDRMAEEQPRENEGKTHTESQETHGAEPETAAPVQDETSEIRQEQEEASAAPPQNSNSVSISTGQPDQVQETPQEEPVSYVGKILTGSEVAVAAAAEEQKGARLYLVTRENGEGYFSASVIAGMVDSTCSYLVEGSDGVHISFIQQ